MYNMHTYIHNHAIYTHVVLYSEMFIKKIKRIEKKLTPLCNSYSHIIISACMGHIVYNNNIKAVIMCAQLFFIILSYKGNIELRLYSRGS